MNRRFRIAIGDEDDRDRAILREGLSRAGHHVIVETGSGRELVERCTTNNGDAVQLIITDVKLQGIDGLEAAAKILQLREIPFIIVTGVEDDQLIERANACGAFAYLVKPVRDVELRAAICIAAQRLQELQSLRMEATSMRQALEDRKIIERAKGILMRQRGLDEPSAFKSLQQLARQHRQKLVEVAKSINLADRMLGSR